MIHYEKLQGEQILNEVTIEDLYRTLPGTAALPSGGCVMPHCGFCGAEIPFDARFCGSCGKPLPDVFGEHLTGENKTILSDPRLPRVSMASGTPPVSGAPSIPGTPHTPPPFYEPLSQFPYHPPTSSPQQTPPAPGQQWSQQQQPLPPPRYQHIVRTPISQNSRTGKQGKTSKAFPMLASRWLFLIVLAILLIIGSGAILVFASSPTLTLSGSQVVSPGETLHLHGSGFIPGGNVHFTLDNTLPLAPVAQRVPEASPRYTGAAALSVDELGLTASSPASASGATVSVSIIGTFDANIPVTIQWQSGVHTIHATESLGSRAASFTVTVQASGLSVSPSALNFNKVARGKKVFLPLLIGNTGQQRLNWSAEIGASWLSVPTSQGVVDPGKLRQIIYIQADTSNLSLGNHAATVHIVSNGGQKQIAVSIQVVQQQNQPVLNLFPSSLDFGTLPAGQQATLQVAVSNLGSQALIWQVAAANANWLTFSQSSGTIKSGGLPQTIYVTTNTGNLAAGNYTAQLQFTSNGGNVSMTATLAVSTATTPTPTPTSSHPPTLTVTPTSLDSSTDCAYTQGQGWLCQVTLENLSTTQGDLNWSASASGISGIQFYPSNSGAILPGEASQVYVLIPDTTCPARATLSFVGPANSINVPWNCPALTPTPTPSPSPTPIPPVLMVTPTQLDPTQSACSSNDGQTYQCQVMVSETSDSQGNANWYAQTNDQNVSFDPQNGSLSPGGSVQVNISGIPCQSDTFTFSGQENEQPVTVSWLCAPTPTPTPSPSQSGTPTPTPTANIARWLLTRRLYSLT